MLTARVMSAVKRGPDGKFTPECGECGWSRQRHEWPTVSPYVFRAVVDSPALPGVVQDGMFIPMPFYHGSPGRFVRGRLGAMKAWILGSD